MRRLVYRDASHDDAGLSRRDRAAFRDASEFSRRTLIARSEEPATSQSEELPWTADAAKEVTGPPLA